MLPGLGRLWQGADIDIRVVRDGKGPDRNVWSNFRQVGGKVCVCVCVHTCVASVALYIGRPAMEGLRWGREG